MADAAVAPLSLEPAGVTRPVPVKVLRTRRECSGVLTLTLGRPWSGFAFAPGQFNMLYAFGVGEAAISFSGDPAETQTLAHTIRDVGAVSKALTGLRAGDMLGVRGPFGRGWPLPPAGSDVVIMAGGLGLAPLKPLIHRLTDLGADIGRVFLLCGARTPDTLLYPGARSTWNSRRDWSVQVITDQAAPDWTGPVGVVTELLGGCDFDPVRTAAYLCGPEIMMRFSARALQDRGVPAGRIFLSLERNMKCAVAHCGRCQFGSVFVCREGPVFSYRAMSKALTIREL